MSRLVALADRTVLMPEDLAEKVDRIRITTSEEPGWRPLTFSEAKRFLAEQEVAKHMGPGPHPSGSPQSVHGGNHPSASAPTGGPATGTSHGGSSPSAAAGPPGTDLSALVKLRELVAEQEKIKGQGELSFSDFLKSRGASYDEIQHGKPYMTPVGPQQFNATVNRFAHNPPTPDPNFPEEGRIGFCQVCGQAVRKHQSDRYREKLRMDVVQQRNYIEEHYPDDSPARDSYLEGLARMKTRLADYDRQGYLWTHIFGGDNASNVTVEPDSYFPVNDAKERLGDKLKGSTTFFHPLDDSKFHEGLITDELVSEPYMPALEERAKLRQEWTDEKMRRREHALDVTTQIDDIRGKALEQVQRLGRTVATQIDQDAKVGPAHEWLKPGEVFESQYRSSVSDEGPIEGRQKYLLLGVDPNHDPERLEGRTLHVKLLENEGAGLSPERKVGDEFWITDRGVVGKPDANDVFNVGDKVLINTGEGGQWAPGGVWTVTGPMTDAGEIPLVRINEAGGERTATYKPSRLIHQTSEGAAISAQIAEQQAKMAPALQKRRKVRDLIGGFGGRQGRKTFYAIPESSIKRMGKRKGYGEFIVMKQSWADVTIPDQLQIRTVERESEYYSGHTYTHIDEDSLAAAKADWESRGYRVVSGSDIYNSMAWELNGAWGSGSQAKRAENKIKKLTVALNGVKYTSHDDFSDSVTGVISKYRDVGGKDFDFKSRSAGAQMVKDVQHWLPDDWVDASNKLGKLSVRKSGARGEYSTWKQSIRSDSHETVLHELGHRIEDAIPEIRVLERTYYEKRTAGGEYVPLSSLFPGFRYGRGEKSIPDEFNHAYMGKRYGVPGQRGEAYELLSMGLERVFDERSVTTRGGEKRDLPGYRDAERAMSPDFREFILGVLAAGGAS